MSLSFSTICERMRAHAVYMGEGLLFPPATEAEIQACEARLGFSLPPMLRELYMTVANGSDFFWWGYNFYTISDDFARKHTN
jgi:cell wall assembly regulator SMI1